MRRFAEILSTVLITAGLVLALEVGLTLAWSEPVSNLDAWLAQRDAADELERLEAETARRDPEAATGPEPTARQVSRRASRFAGSAGEGEAVGRILIEAIGLNIVAVEGTDSDSLTRGPGHYPETSLPGQAGTTAFAGHRTTYLAPFRDVNRLAAGDAIIVRMPYGTFTYEYESQRIVSPTETSVVDDVGQQQLVLTACHPLYSAAERIVVFARLSGAEPATSARGNADAAASEIGAPGLGPTLAGAFGLLPIAALMWFWGGRTIRAKGPEARPGR